MKKILSLILITAICILAGCSGISRQESAGTGYQSYKEIPGVTQEEIDAVEELLANKPRLTFGKTVSSESFMLEDGSIGGFSALFCNRMSELFGFEFDLSLHTWDEIVEKITSKEMDFASDFTPTPERLQKYFMTEVIIQRTVKIFTDRNAESLSVTAKSRPIKCAFNAGSTTYKSVADTWNLPFEPIFINNESLVPELLLNGEIDAFIEEGVLEAAYDAYDFIKAEEYYPLTYSPVSLTTGNPELEPVISVMQKYLKSGGNYELTELYNQGYREYLKYRLSLHLTDEEKNYILRHNTEETAISAACETDNYPSSFYNEKEKEFQGVAIDVLKQVSDLTGLRFKAGNSLDGSWAELLEGLEAGKYSVVSELLQTANRENRFLWTQEPYYTDNYAMISKSGYPDVDINQILFARVGLIKGSAYADVFFEWFPKSENIKEYVSNEEAFAALEKGEIDLLMANQNLLLHLTNYLEKPGYKTNIVFNYSTGSFFGLNKNEELLCSIINKAQRYIDTGEITESWKRKVFDYESRLLRDLIPYTIIFSAIVLTALFVVFVLFMKNKRISRNLEKLVAERTNELALQSSMLSTMFDSIPDLVFCKDSNFRFTRCNRSFVEYFGWREQDIIGREDSADLGMTDEEINHFRSADRKVMSERRMIAVEEYIPAANGVPQLFETVKIPLVQDGDVIGIMGISRNITQRKASEETLKLTLADLDRQLAQQSLMTSISQSFLTDADIDTLITNALSMTGEFMNIAQIVLYKLDDDGVTLVCQNEWTKPELGLGLLKDKKIRLKEEMLNIIKKLGNERDICLHSNDPSFKEAMVPYRMNFKNYITTPIFINGKMYGVLDFSKEDDGSLWSKSDLNLATLVSSLLPGVFERHFMESELITAKDLAELGSRSKSDFLARMSHEIRTPLNAVIGMNSIARNTDDPAKIRDCQDKIDNASKHLLGVINDILDMSKIEADKFELSYSEFDFEKTLMNITNVVNFRSEEKRQNLIVNLNENIPDFILSDEMRLSQVITNLLSNAVKFTPENGTVVLNVEQTDDKDGEVTLRIDVTDNGIGISEEQKSRLFNSFEQADGSISRKFGGTGLGLAISKRIVELMGGRIWVESEFGKGSKFIFTIKAKKGAERTHAKLSPQINKDNIHILAVDDSAEARICFSHIMEAHGLPCDTAASGAEALDMIRKCKDKPYNIFFVDWQMPEMDGIELTKRIKEISGENSVVFMISVADWNTIEKEALSAGVKQFVPKPLFPSLLINAVNECLGVESAKTEVRGMGFENSLKLGGHTILIAEDVEINQEIMSAVLEETGVSIDFAENGQSAVSMFKAEPDKYSLILMDIHMPEMNGYEATRTIRALESEKAKTIPIIAMTANVFREDVENCLAAGMNDHVGKPIDAKDLFTKLSKYSR